LFRFVSWFSHQAANASRWAFVKSFKRRRIKVKNIELLIVLLFLFFFSACQPLVEANATQSTSTIVLNNQPELPTKTNTPQIALTASLTPEANTCAVDKQLPNPDIPENYIGWKPGVDFSELYNKENGDRNYMYWESSLNGYDNFSVAGYKRSDNSYLLLVEKLACRDTNNDRVYEVVEAVRTQPLKENEDIAPLNFVCYRFRNGEVEEEVFAIVNKDSGQAIFVWRMDLEKKEIQETSPEGIECSPSGITAPNK
jgi:hypothetical protein